MSTNLAALLERVDVLRLLRDALREHEPWLVGGTVRDLIMGRSIYDFDLVVAEDPESGARRVAQAAGGHAFPLSERFGAWRAIAPDRSWQADVSAARDGTIEADLAQRDFTINAMATPLRTGQPLLDPYGGRDDIERRLVRVLGEHSYGDDPLRTLRMARLACELEFEVEPQTRRLAERNSDAIAKVAPERVFYELRRLVVSNQVMRGLELMQETRLIAVLLPELAALKGVGQNPYHHLDVWGHSLAVLESLMDLERDLSPLFGESADAISSELDRRLADELTRAQALRFAALFHDVGKPATRTVMEDGRILFWRHDEVGADLSRAVCRRLRTSTDTSDFLAEITRHHLRLGFLVHERPLSRRHIYRYLRACEPVELEVTILSVADRLATRGARTRQEAVDAHLELARDLGAEAISWRLHGPPRPLVAGDELMGRLGLQPGPRIGELLEMLREATFTGEVKTGEQALERARAETRDDPTR